MLDQSNARITESIQRVAKKQFKEDPEAGAKFVDRSLYCCDLFLTLSPSSLSNMNISTTVDSSIQTADLVLEAVSENMALKQKLFAEYDDKVRKGEE